MKKYLGLSLCFLIFQQVFSQQSEIYLNETQNFNQALILFNGKQYQASQILFEKIKQTEKNTETIADCNYYIANCAIRTNQDAADELMEKFLKNNPTSSKQNAAVFEVAQYYFAQANYVQALKWYDQIDESTLSNEELEKANFQRGYTQFNSKNKKEATKYFNKVANSAIYGNQAKYYLGYLAYDGNKYEEANELFGQVTDQEKYKEKMGYFQADMNFKLGNFQKAIDLGEPQLKKSSALEKSELSKIIGESYFNLKQYDKALPYLLAYKGKNNKWSNTDYYMLGYTYYQQKNYENAILQFNKIIDGADFVAQNAYYHLAESYLKLDKKQQALTAFKTASEMNFDVKIQEDAALNYTKLSYEIGNPFVSTPEVLKKFIEKYPTNANITELKSLLINSYISSKNYNEALVLLEKNKTEENKPAYQKVTFYKGLESYTDGKYTEALELFKKSLTEKKDNFILTRTTFWKAETEYNLDQFTDAEATYKQFLALPDVKNTEEFKTAHYNLAYTHFKNKDYKNAIIQFNSHITLNTADKARLADAYLRLADCNYISTQYLAAITAYEKAIELKSVDADYAAFQKAMSKGLINKNDKKIEDLKQFTTTYTTSQYLDDALFELGNTYAQTDNNDKAIATFEVLINNQKNSGYLVKALLKQGIIYYNTDKDEQALAKFKKVTTDFPGSPESFEAVSTAKSIFESQNKMSDYANWIKTLTFIDITEDELDSDVFDNAEKLYLSNKPAQAIPALVAYVKEYPKGKKVLKAQVYLAQLYYDVKEVSNATIYYEGIIALNRSEHTEQALTRLSDIYLKEKNCTKAITVLKRLETEAEFPQNITYAQANLMKCYFEQDDFVNAEIYSDKVLKNPKTETKIKSDAQIIIARSAIKTNNLIKAKEAYAKLQKIAKGELAAEALYYDAYFKNAEAKYEASNKVIEKYSSIYSGYQFFGAKGLVLMAKNFYALKDSFQATEILQSVIDNFTEFTEVVAEAKTELDKIKTEEAKTNSSISK